MGRLKRTGLYAAGLAALLAATPVAEAQYRLEFSYCDRLTAQYQGAVERAGNAAMTGRQMVQIDQVRQALAQAQTAAQRYGCYNGGFLGQLFGMRQSPQCPVIMGEVNRLGRQLSQLRGNSGGFFGSSPEYDVARLRDALIQGGCGVPRAGGTRTLCVRTCDGYYFPIEYSASSSRFETDAAACQSMYAHDGEAELFVQSNSDDVANATSLSGERYGDQSYAFLYRDTYAPACATQLHEGIAALAQRYFSRVPARRNRVASVPARPLPIPRARPPVSEDPETIANLAGGFHIKPVVPPAVAMSEVPAKAVRMVGPAYYADLFDLTKARKAQALRPTLSLVGAAEAAEAPKPAAVTVPPADD